MLMSAYVLRPTWQAKQQLLSTFIGACCEGSWFARLHVHSRKMYLSSEVFNQHIFDQILCSDI